MKSSFKSAGIFIDNVIWETVSDYFVGVCGKNKYFSTIIGKLTTDSTQRIMLCFFSVTFCTFIFFFFCPKFLPATTQLSATDQYVNQVH